jgi:hypothetical protein
VGGQMVGSFVRSQDMSFCPSFRIVVQFVFYIFYLVTLAAFVPKLAACKHGIVQQYNTALLDSFLLVKSHLS